jgi:hypothetical protein
MPVRWRPPGSGMATIDLHLFQEDQIVIHFGGALTSIDAYTFANSLVAFADTVRSANGIINPGQGIEVRVEALGPGSFRAVIKRITKGLGGFFSDGATRIFWGLIAALIYDKLIRADPSPHITINTTEVIFQLGHDRVIVPRAVYDQMENVKTDPEVQNNLSRTFQAIEFDEAIENFGLTPTIDDPEPVVQISRDNFPRLATPVLVEGDPKRQDKIERARLVILKAWLTPGRRKWSFEWNGVPLSAPITDPGFWEKLSDGLLIGQGDALDVELKFQQVRDDNLGVWVNDPHTFDVIRVSAHIPKAPRPPRLID